ncbi:hypothetical protein ACMAUO_05785 [Gluconacetobacter sp. Hr-1-5]|uniref:hypothetical protein n=1 Tax=Gluconacetobacter sp. Hr-1-5 TaxID=3395370 RepID=UPI003B52C9DD
MRAAGGAAAANLILAMVAMGRVTQDGDSACGIAVTALLVAGCVALPGMRGLVRGRGVQAAEWVRGLRRAVRLTVWRRYRSRVGGLMRAMA